MREEEKLVGESHTVSACFPLTSRDFSRHEKGTGEKRLCSCLQAKQREKRGIAKKGGRNRSPLAKGRERRTFFLPSTSMVLFLFFFRFCSSRGIYTEERGRRDKEGRREEILLCDMGKCKRRKWALFFSFLSPTVFIVSYEDGGKKEYFSFGMGSDFFHVRDYLFLPKNSLLLTVFWDFQVVNVCKKSGKSCFSRITFGKLRWRRACFIAECVISPFPFFLFRKYTGERSEPRWILFWSEGNEILKGF